MPTCMCMAFIIAQKCLIKPCHVCAGASRIFSLLLSLLKLQLDSLSLCSISHISPVLTAPFTSLWHFRQELVIHFRRPKIKLSVLISHSKWAGSLLVNSRLASESHAIFVNGSHSFHTHAHCTHTHTQTKWNDLFHYVPDLDNNLTKLLTLLIEFIAIFTFANVAARST